MTLKTGGLKIQLLTFPGCPNAEETQRILKRVLTRLAADDKSFAGNAGFEEINVHHPATPAELRNYPSPTLLVNGRDLEGVAPANDGAACRIYGASGGVPDEEKVEAFIRSALAKTG